MKKYDVIIVGCGPAGVSAAKVLEKNNISFCVIEKNKFPREKLCGGGLTHKSTTLLDDLEFNYSKIENRACNEVKFISGKLCFRMPLINEIVMVNRLQFDNNNSKQIDRKNLFENEKIISVDKNTLVTDKDEYEFKYIIFADGVNGFSKKLIENRQFGFCVECDSKTQTNETVLDFCSIECGYGWIFPKSDHTNIGLGNFNVKRFDYLDLLYSFAEKYNIEIDKAKIRGYHIPVFSEEIYKKSVIDSRYILVGDSASLVDQVSGEGIYYALFSGKAAAESIIECLNTTQDLKSLYFRKTESIYKSLRKRKMLSKLLYSGCGRFFIKLGLSNKFFIKKLNKMFG